MTEDMVTSLFTYREGNLHWRVDRPHHKCKGVLVGCIHHSGYRVMTVDRRQYSIHRLVYLYHHGYMPKAVDHINGIKDDNHIENLRECTTSQNGMNRKVGSNSSTGCVGICFTKGKWQAQIKVKGKMYYLGQHNTLFDAACIRKSAELHRFGSFAPIKRED